MIVTMKKKTVYKKMIGVRDIERLAFAPKSLSPRYNTAKYASRTGFFIDPFHYSLKDKKEFRFTYHGQLYTVARHVAAKNIVTFEFMSTHPTVIPLECWTRSEIPNDKIAVEWIIDPVRNVATPIEYVPDPEQMSFL